MNQSEITSYSKLTDTQKQELVQIFIEGFGHLMTFSKDQEELERLFLKVGLTCNKVNLFLWGCFK